MADLRSEIEARKSRIAELKRQREALALSGLGSAPSSPAQPDKAQLSLVSMAGPQIEVDAPFLYTKSVQTECVSAAHSSPTHEDPSHQDPSHQNLSQQDRSHQDLSHPDADRSDQKIDSTAPTTEPANPAEQKHVHQFTVAESFKDVSAVPPSFITFLDSSWRAIARAGSPRAIQDYTAVRNGAGSTGAGSQDAQTAELVETLDAACGLAVWSPHFPELFVALGGDRRRACVWSTDALEKPEFSLRSPTQLSRLLFSPHSAQYVYGGGANGQLFAWDLRDTARTRGARFDLLPQLRSPIENTPVIGLAFVGPNLVTLNEDGVLGVWNTDALSRPRHYIILEDRLRAGLNALKLTSPPIPTTMAAYEAVDAAYGLGYGIGICVVGTIQGYLLRVPAQPASEPLVQELRHAAPISCLSFRRSAPPGGEDGRTGALLISGGMDWKLRLWYVPSEETERQVELLQFDIDFAVADVAWHPTIPSVFAAVGDSEIQIWNLDVNTAKPVFATTVKDKLSAVGFSGSRLSVAGETSARLFALKHDEPLLRGSDKWLLANEKYKP